jgi:hypothetical protein
MGFDILTDPAPNSRSGRSGGTSSPTLCSTSHRKIAKRCRYWHSNDWDGLDGQSARELGRVLRARVWATFRHVVASSQ